MGDQNATAKIEPAKKWTVAIIPHEHLDIGFTDYPAKVAELHAQSIDSAMELIKKTPDFRWTLDGSWVANQYLNGRSADAQKEFLAHVRDGSITIPPEFANQHTGNASWEALARSLYNQHELATEFKLPGGRRGADRRRAGLHVGLRLGATRCGNQVLHRRKQQLARTNHAAGSVE